jgi:hypothetical protein
MEEYVERRASAHPENVRRLTAVRVNRNSAVYVSRDTYARETRRAPQPPPHDASYFNLNNTETPTAEPFTRLGGLQREVGGQLVGVDARASVARRLGCWSRCVRRPRDLPTANSVRAH